MCMSILSLIILVKPLTDVLCAKLGIMSSSIRPDMCYFKRLESLVDRIILD